MKAALSSLTCLVLALLAAPHAGAQPPDPLPMATPPGPPPAGVFGDERPLRPPIERFFAILKQTDPEEYERLRALREKDPVAFRAEIAQRLIQERERRAPRGDRNGEREGRRPARGALEPGPYTPPMGAFDAWASPNPEADQLELKSRELARALKEATSPEDQARLRAELKSTLLRAFELREQMRRERLAQMEDRVIRIKKLLDERAAQRDAIIQRRMDELIGSETLAW